MFIFSDQTLEYSNPVQMVIIIDQAVNRWLVARFKDRF